MVFVWPQQGIFSDQFMSKLMFWKLGHNACQINKFCPFWVTVTVTISRQMLECRLQD